MASVPRLRSPCRARARSSARSQSTPPSPKPLTESRSDCSNRLALTFPTPWTLWIREQRRVLAEEGLRETRDYLENLIDYANAPIIVWDPSFKITRFNHAFERLTGLRTSEAIGEQLDTLFPEESRDASLEYISRTLSGERWEVVEIPIKKIDGSVRTVLWNSANIYDKDGTTAVATIAQGQDITERKQAEEALRETKDYLENLIDYANAPIIVWDTSFRISRFNHAFERLTGLDALEVHGKPLDILFPEAKQGRFIEVHKTCFIWRTLGGSGDPHSQD